MFLSIHDEQMFQPFKASTPMAHRFFTYLFINASSCQQLYILDNEVLLGILFNDPMEINISVIALFVFYQST